jgi:Tfp pilus assembly pilus retraction ATPase PilT
MYSMDDLLHLVHSDGADELKLHVGQPPVIVIDGEQQPIEGPAITAENAEQLLRSITDTRQRRCRLRLLPASELGRRPSQPRMALS